LILLMPAGVGAVFLIDLTGFFRAALCDFAD
jgi:hypothetical protein